MTTIMPIIVPVHVSEPECPQCGRLEDTKVVCRHCGYEYEDDANEPSIFKIALIVIACVIVGVWLLLTGLDWAFRATLGPASLTEILSGQLKWLLNLRF